MSRRRMLAGMAAVAAGGVGGIGAKAASLSHNDARLLVLHAEANRAAEEEEAAVEAAASAAFGRWSDALYAMAALPADGMTGLAVKAAHVCNAMVAGDSAADEALCASLQADIARLVPAAVAT
ncbi:hypothetical protein [Roseomonas chloroacetimidivorans]|uniref:hypothetical protein n=1 Tax=Roseomonas chloroacetimidivorans TaxID=1766656 RepID=UPI003C782709